jgi:hypothetical protein
MLIAILSDVMRETDEYGSASKSCSGRQPRVHAMRHRRLDGSANRPVLREAMTPHWRLRMSQKKISGAFEPQRYFRDQPRAVIGRSARKRCDRFRSDVTGYSSGSKAIAGASSR